MSKKFIIIVCHLLLCLGLFGCNLPGNVPTEPAPTETALLLPSDTPIPTLTATLAPSETPTPEIPTAEVFRETNCRTGPAGNYDLVAIIAPGTTVEIIGADLGAGYYWFIRNPENPDQSCWLLAQNAKVIGNTSLLPALSPMPSPTSAPAFQVAFKNFDVCKGGYFARFSITNTGDVQFRSAYIKVTNTKNGEVQEQSLNAFDLTEGCIIAKNVAPLLPGQTGHLDSPRFNKDPRNQRLTAIIMVCTEQNLKGTCVTQTLDVRP